jgi:ribosomal protein S18 acetylase RimI-like enzyme
MRIRRLTPPDRSDLVELLDRVGTFNPEEIRVALEVLDAAIAEPGKDYDVLVAEVAGRVRSYVCFGPTPMTEASYDLYWIATHPEATGQGLASKLVHALEREITTGGRTCNVRIETSQLESYGSARRFYERAGYHEAGRIRDFYKPGDDLVIFAKQVRPHAEAHAGVPGASPVLEAAAHVPAAAQDSA